MRLEEYEKLPDRLPVEKLTSMFQDVLFDFDIKKINKNEFLEIINELMDRQVMSYELLDNNTRNNLDVIISSLWNTNSYEDVDIILSIVVNLGLEKCYEKIKSSIKDKNSDDIDNEILEEIIETIKETGDSVSNPYQNLEKFK